MSTHQGDSPSRQRPSTPRPVPRTNTFTCVRCGLTVGALDPEGSVRNHCPSCLHSRHLDDHVDGGPSECRARMSPISVAVPRAGDWTVVHRCTRCGELATGPVSPDDNHLILMRMAVRPLATPPFPLELFGEL
ncbi:RNHCP domain-containing protein [Streptomyces sp. NPDC006798]|uniref:RNHCP domain-containing protein n=1 Tax=Streptomyces sp. NPDC006798 TaxID=3155462 RepID=UPI0033E12AF1